MKCTRCGAASDVLATREYMEVFSKRTRQCHNGHRFHTYEVTAGNLDRRTLADTLRGVEKGRITWRRRQTILRSTESASVLAAQLGVTEARVRQIRQEARNAEVA